HRRPAISIPVRTGNPKRDSDRSLSVFARAPSSPARSAPVYPPWGRAATRKRWSGRSGCATASWRLLRRHQRQLPHARRPHHIADLRGALAAARLAAMKRMNIVPTLGARMDGGAGFRLVDGVAIANDHGVSGLGFV